MAWGGARLGVHAIAAGMTGGAARRRAGLRRLAVLSVAGLAARRLIVAAPRQGRVGHQWGAARRQSPWPGTGHGPHQAHALCTSSSASASNPSPHSRLHSCTTANNAPRPGSATRLRTVRQTCADSAGEKRQAVHRRAAATQPRACSQAARPAGCQQRRPAPGRPCCPPARPHLPRRRRSAPRRLSRPPPPSPLLCTTQARRAVSRAMTGAAHGAAVTSRRSAPQRQEHSRLSTRGACLQRRRVQARGCRLQSRWSGLRPRLSRRRAPRL